MIDPDIRRARLLTPAVYRDPALLAAARERAFATSWQLLFDGEGAVDAASLSPGELRPVTLLEGFLDEPLLLSRDGEGTVRCLSNVCTHRGNLLCERPERAERIRCRYHGRRFHLDGRFLSMPEFEDAVGFPSESDDLPRLELGRWGPFWLTRLAGGGPSLDELMAPVRDRLAFLPLERLRADPSRTQHYSVAASWALYVDNYLEGFHIPYVHPGLNRALDYDAYRTLPFEGGVLQIGVAAPGEEAFALPAGSPDHGQAIAGYYLWLFPNLMFNVYPWGISVNVVTPLAVDRCRVTYFGYVLDPDRLGRGAGGDLDRVEREDEEVVELVQRGVGSRLYRPGRYSPSREQGVHHFHRMLARVLGPLLEPPRPGP